MSTHGPSTAEQARTLVASANTASLATLTADGDPWASFVTYGLLGGAPVLCVSSLAEHGRNLAGDPRASLVIVAPSAGAAAAATSSSGAAAAATSSAGAAPAATSSAGAAPDPLAGARVTLTGIAERPTGAELAAAREAHLAAVPTAGQYIDFTDFTLWVLRVHRVRWIGGYGQMDTITGETYAAASPDPIRRTGDG